MRDGLSIAIVGGGPVGLTTALLLARAGHVPTVIDARPVSAAVADRRLLALSRGTWQVLHPLLGAALPTGEIRRVWVSSAGEFGRTLLSSDDLDDPGQPLGVTVYYGDLLTALDAAAARVGIQQQRGAAVERSDELADHVALRLADGRELRADLLVHAEGGPTAQTGVAPEAWALLAEVEMTPPRTGAAFERFTREGPLALLPLPGGAGRRWSLIWCMSSGAAQRRATLNAAELQHELQQAIGPRIGRLTQMSPARAIALPEHAREQLATSRTVWLGNAAQTLHPVAGQGFNLGVRDIISLREALHAAAGDVPRALADYARRRRRDRGVIRTVTRWLPDVFAARVAPMPALRALGLTALDLVRPLRASWARLLMFGVRD